MGRMYEQWRIGASFGGCLIRHLDVGRRDYTLRELMQGLEQAIRQA
jgi:hypothetical protein